MKYFTKILCAASCGVAITGLSSCDTEDRSNQGSQIISPSRGYDVAALQAAPNDTADFPTALASGETITFTGSPAPLDVPLTVSSSRQIIIESVRFNYVNVLNQVNTAEITQSVNNAVIRDRFAADLLAIVQSGSSSSAGSLSNALQRPIDYDPTKGFLDFTEAERRTIVSAIESSGYVVRRTAAGGIQVLENREITLTANSTNLDLTNNLQVTGDHELNDRWWPIVLIVTEGVDLLELSLLTDINDQAVLIPEVSNGNFVLQLNSLTQI